MISIEKVDIAVIVPMMLSCQGIIILLWMNILAIGYAFQNHCFTPTLIDRFGDTVRPHRELIVFSWYLVNKRRTSDLNYFFRKLGSIVDVES